ncbi:hypothetical protein Tco_0238209 [Tanacetum coccineum]
MSFTNCFRVIRNFIWSDADCKIAMFMLLLVILFKGWNDSCSNTDFKRRMCNIAWTDKIKPETFNEKWAAIMDEFSLNKNKWLSDMFKMCDRWIPAYFCNEPMSGLMRTMSRTLFYDVQEEIYSSLMNCYALNVHEGESHRHFVNYVPSEEPEEVTIHLPNGIRNKGTGHDKRYVSKSEIASTQSNKPKRLCRNCGKYVHHDSRNCPARKKYLDNQDVAMEHIEEDA